MQTDKSNTPNGEVTDGLLRKARAAFYGQVTAMDDMIGEIIQRLKDIGQYDS